MRVHRDRAAEEVAAAAVKLSRLLSRVQREQVTRCELERDLLEAALSLQVAARHLEAAGAETMPE